MDTLGSQERLTSDLVPTKGFYPRFYLLSSLPQQYLFSLHWQSGVLMAQKLDRGWEETPSSAGREVAKHGGFMESAAAALD